MLQIRRLHDKPLIFFGDQWAKLVDWARRGMLRPGHELVSPEDMTIPRCVRNAGEAIAIREEHHARRQDLVARASGEAPLPRADVGCGERGANRTSVDCDRRGSYPEAPSATAIGAVRSSPYPAGAPWAALRA